MNRDCPWRVIAEHVGLTECNLRRRLVDRKAGDEENSHNQATKGLENRMGQDAEGNRDADSAHVRLAPHLHYQAAIES